MHPFPWNFSLTTPEYKSYNLSLVWVRLPIQIIDLLFSGMFDMSTTFILRRLESPRICSMFLMISFISSYISLLFLRYFYIPVKDLFSIFCSDIFWELITSSFVFYYFIELNFFIFLFVVDFIFWVAFFWDPSKSTRTWSYLILSSFHASSSSSGRLSIY